MKKVLGVVAATTTVGFSTVGCSADVTEKQHSTEKLLRDGYNAFNQKDMATVMALVANDVSLVVPGRSIQSGTFKGKGELERYFSIVGKHTAGTHKVEILEVMADDSRAILLLRALGQHEDKTLDMTVIHLWRLSEGKLAALSIIPTDQYAFDEFWS